MSEERKPPKKGFGRGRGRGRALPPTLTSPWPRSKPWTQPGQSTDSSNGTYNLKNDSFPPLLSTGEGQFDDSETAKGSVNGHQNEAAVKSKDEPLQRAGIKKEGQFDDSETAKGSVNGRQNKAAVKSKDEPLQRAGIKKEGQFDDSETAKGSVNGRQNKAAVKSKDEPLQRAGIKKEGQFDDSETAKGSVNGRQNKAAVKSKDELLQRAGIKKVEIKDEALHRACMEKAIKLAEEERSDIKEEEKEEDISEEPVQDPAQIRLKGDDEGDARGLNRERIRDVESYPMLGNLRRTPLERHVNVRLSDLSPDAAVFVPRAHMNPDAQNFVPGDARNNSNEQKLNFSVIERSLSTIEETVNFCFTTLTPDAGKLNDLYGLVTKFFTPILNDAQLTRATVESFYNYVLQDCGFAYTGVKILTHLINLPVENSVLGHVTLAHILDEVKTFPNNYLLNLHRIDPIKKYFRPFLMYLAELYIQLEEEGVRLLMLGQGVVEVLSKFMSMEEYPIEDRLKLIESIVKLSGLSLDRDDPSILNQFFIDMRSYVETNYLHLNSRALESLNDMILLRNMCWGHAPDCLPDETSTTTPNNNHPPPDDFEQDYNTYGVFYGPDGNPIDHDEQLFLEIETQRAAYSQMDLNDDYEEAYDEFLLSLPENRDASY